MKHTLIPCTLTLALPACGTVPDLPPGYALSAQDEGLAVVSLTLAGKDLERVSGFEYRVREAVATPAEEILRTRHFSSARQHARWLSDRGPAISGVRLVVKGSASVEPLDVIEAGKAVGRVAVLRLPAGEYELGDWKVAAPTPYGVDELGPTRPMAYRFEVRPGRVTYLGNLNLRILDEDRYNIAVEDKSGRDLALLAKKMPSPGVENIDYRPGRILR